MPENTNESNPLEVLSSVTDLKIPQIVTRNGIDKVLSLQEGKREGWKGKPYQAPQIETDLTKGVTDDSSFLNDIIWFGKENVKNFINTLAKRACQDYVEDSIGEKGTPNAGQFSMDKFLNFVANFAASAMKLSELVELHQAESAKLSNYVSSDEFDSILKSGDMNAIAAAKAKIDTMSSTVKALKLDLDERKARRSKEANMEAATN